MIGMLRDVLQQWAGRRLNRKFDADRAAAANRWNAYPKLTGEEIVNSPYAVAVFTAVWDGRSRHYAPVVDQVTERFGHSALVGFVDTEAEESFVRQLGLTSVPVVGFFRDGVAIALHVGCHLDLERMTELLVVGHETIPTLFMRPARRGVSTC